MVTTRVREDVLEVSGNRGHRTLDSVKVDFRLHPARDSALGRLEGVAVADRLESFVVREQFQDCLLYTSPSPRDS